MQRLLMSEGVWYPLTLTLTTFSWPLSAAQRRLAFGLLIGALRRARLGVTIYALVLAVTVSQVTSHKAYWEFNMGLEEHACVVLFQRDL